MTRPDDASFIATAIASTELLVLSRTGEEMPVTVALGRPYQAPTGEWRCPLRLMGLPERHPDMAGEDSLQALCMAASLVRALLEDVIDKGGRVLDAASRSDYALDAVFGRVGRGPGAPPAGPSPR
jgi:hypothetical protein